LCPFVFFADPAVGARQSKCDCLARAFHCPEALRRMRALSTTGVVLNAHWLGAALQCIQCPQWVQWFCRAMQGRDGLDR
jgi:hypothetical protein